MGENMTPTIKRIFQALPIILLPLVTIHMPSGCMLYWGTTNTFSIFQTLALKNDNIRKNLGVTLAPKPKKKMISMGENDSNNLDPIKKLLRNMEESRQKRKDLDDEILHGIKAGSDGKNNVPPPPKANPTDVIEAHVGGKKSKPIAVFASNPKL